MAKGKLLAGLLVSALFLGCLSPAGTMMAAETGTETKIETEAETEVQKEDTDESLKAAEADENGFVINGIDRYGNDFYIRKELLQ